MKISRKNIKLNRTVLFLYQQKSINAFANLSGDPTTILASTTNMTFPVKN